MLLNNIIYCYNPSKYKILIPPGEGPYVAHLYKCLVIWVLDPSAVFIHNIYVTQCVGTTYKGQSRIVGKLQQAGWGGNCIIHEKDQTE